MNATERASHPSRAQIESLLEFLEGNPSLAKGFSKVPSARDAARRSWETLALQLNSLGGCVKTWKQWTKYWADKKSAVKKKSALRYRARNKTGGGAEVVELNEVEERILTLMGGESFATGDRHLQINPFETSANTSQGQASQTQDSLSLLGSQLLEVDAPLPQIEDHQLYLCSTPSTLSDAVISTRISQSAVHNIAPSPPRTPPRRISGPASPPVPTTPSGSGAHPSGRTLNAQRRLMGTPTRNQPSSPINTPSSPRRRQRRQAVAPPTQRLSQFSRMTERFLAIEEQRIEVDRRNSLLFEAIVNHTREHEEQRIEMDRRNSQLFEAIVNHTREHEEQRIEVDRRNSQLFEAIVNHTREHEEQRIEVDRRNSQLFEAIVSDARERATATSQALLAIGEGLKLLAEVLKQNQTSAS